jgi:hypothetical protein
MSSVYSRGSSNVVNRSFLDNNDPERRKRQSCGLILTSIFIIAVIIAISLTIVHIDQVPSANEQPTPPPFNVGTIAPPATAEGQPTKVPTEAPTITGYQACNGFESLCDVPANLVLYATLHNAVATLEDGVSIVPNHELQLEKALQSGWRGFNFDIGKCSQFTDQPVRLVHAICSLGTRDPIEVFTNILTFLERRPNEVLLMPVQIDNSLDGGAVSYAEIYAVMDQVPGFTALLYQHPGFGTPWPTLRELIAANTRILFFLYNGDTLCVNAADGCPPGFHDWFTYAAETEFQFDSADDLINNTSTSCAITRGAQGSRDFFGINYFTTIPSSTTCADIHQANKVKSHIEACTALNAPISPSLIIVDYWNIGNVDNVVAVYNELLASSIDTSQQTRQLSATVTMNFMGTFNSTMDDTVQDTFLSTCSDYYNRYLTNWTGVTCTEIVNQTIVPLGRRRQQNGRYRYLQAESILQVTVRILGYEASNNSDTSLSTANLETPLETTSISFAESLSRVSDFFFNIIDIVIRIDDEVITNAPTMVPSSPPETFTPSTSRPMVNTLAPITTSPTEIPSRAPVMTTITPVASTEPPVTSTPEPFLCNGHANLCDRSVSDILFATVHNAASTFADGVFLFPNHENSLEDALVAGYRGINVDIGVCGDTIRLVHGLCALGYREIVPTFSNIVRFLQENTNEVIIMPVQIDNDVGGDVTLQEIDNILQLVPGMKEIMYNHPSDATSWPTLRELITANTRILFFVYNGERCYGAEATVSCPVGIHDWFQYAGESEFQFETPDQLINDKAYACAITRGGSGLLDFYGVNVFTTIPRKRNCEELNTQANLESHLSSCSSLTGQTIVNLLLVDCWDVGDVISVVNTYNAAL